MNDINQEIVYIIKNNISNKIKTFIPQIANKSLSSYELESIFLNHGNGQKLYMITHPNMNWEELSLKDKKIWNSKAKKEQPTLLCKAKKKCGAICTTIAKNNGYCGKHKYYAENITIAKEISDSINIEIGIKTQTIDGKIYIIDQDNKVFDNNELVGVYNPDTKKIEQTDDIFDNSSIESQDEEY